MKKLFLLCIIALCTTTSFSQSEITDKLGDFWNESSIRLTNAFGYPTFAGTLKYQWREFGINRTSFLGLTSVGLEYDLLKEADASLSFGLGWNTASKIPTLTAGFESEPFSFIEKWGMDQASFRVFLINSLTEKGIEGRQYWGGSIVQLPIQTDWDWLNNLLGDKSSKKIVLSLYSSQQGGGMLNDGKFRFGGGLGFEFVFGGREAMDELRSAW